MSQPYYLDDFFTFLRFQTISADPNHAKDLQDCAAWLKTRLEKIGLHAEVHQTQGHPIVLAKNQYRKDRKTVMIYGHYDVQPADPLELWHHPPFEPHLENGIVTARGATDDKGQILSHILGIEKVIKEKGDLPVNITIIIEGEEEVGSEHLLEFVKKHKNDLVCDVIAISDTMMLGTNQPALTYGLRGICTCEISLYGPAMDLHSGVYGGAVVNPVTALARLISTLHNEKWHVQVKGFYDKVATIQDWERQAWSQMARDRSILEIAHVPALDGEAGFTSIERTTTRPTAEVNGFYGGYQGAGSKTVLPKEAHAKLSFRLVPNQEPDEILRLVKKHFKKHCPPTVRMDFKKGHRGQPYFMEPTKGFGAAAAKAIERVFNGTKPAFIREGGSIPIVTDFKHILGVDTLLIGLALPDCNEHSPNETFHLANLETGMRLNEALLEEIAVL